MKYYSLNCLVGIGVDDTYPWHDTLFFNNNLSSKDPMVYNSCQAFIEVRYQKELDLSDVRWIGDNAYIGGGIYVDKGYGVRVERLGSDHIIMTVSQECNEWLIILLELSLISLGYTMIHGAAVEREGAVYLMPSWGGVGKTATVCEFVRNQGWKLLGDDLIIVREGFAMPFLKPFVIYPYHKDLFPEVFKTADNYTIKNNWLSGLMSKAIPTVKRVLRPFPRVLAFLRKHNPQSTRVSPYVLFESSQLSDGGVPVYTVWLERSRKESVQYNSVDAQEIESKTVAVTLSELFAAKLNDFYQMCGCGLFNFDETMNRMYRIIDATFRNTSCSVLEIPASVSINHVGEIVYRQIMKDE